MEGVEVEPETVACRTSRDVPGAVVKGVRTLEAVPPFDASETMGREVFLVSCVESRRPLTFAALLIFKRKEAKEGDSNTGAEGVFKIADGGPIVTDPVGGV